MTKQEIEQKREQFVSGLPDVPQKWKDKLIGLYDAFSALEEVDSKQERWKPESGEEYFYVDEMNKVGDFNFRDDSMDLGLWELGNCFKTEEEAELHKLRLESMANRGSLDPENGYWYWDFTTSRPNSAPSGISSASLADYWIGNRHKRLKDAEAWGEKYANCFSLDHGKTK